MGEGSIKETMERLYGAGTIPQKKVPAEEMKRRIMESKVQLQAKKGKSIESMKTEGTKDIEKGGMYNYPCPRCKEIKWMKVPDGRYYCLKCGEVIQSPSTDAKGEKEIKDQHKTPAPASDEIEKKVETVDSIDKPEKRFNHPRVENAICNGCFHDMGCPRTFQHMVLCLLNNIDYKMKRFRSD